MEASSPQLTAYRGNEEICLWLLAVGFYLRNFFLTDVPVARFFFAFGDSPSSVSSPSASPPKPISNSVSLRIRSRSSAACSKS